MWNKLPTRIRLQNITMKDLWKENFSAMVQHLVRVEIEKARPINQLNPVSSKKAEYPSNKKSTHTVNSKTSSSAFVSHSYQPRTGSGQRQPFQPGDRGTPKPPAPLLPNRNPFGRSSHTPAKDQVKCYRCGEYGHFKDECPKPVSVNELGGDPEGQQDKEEAVEEETEETLEGNEEA